MDDRYAAQRAVLGEDAHARLKGARMLVVGAGGIGCEVLKDLVLLGVGHIEIVRRAAHPATKRSVTSALVLCTPIRRICASRAFLRA